MSRRALAVVVQLSSARGCRNVANLLPSSWWRSRAVGDRITSRRNGETYRVASLLVTNAEPPLTEPVLVRSVAEREATGETLPRDGGGGTVSAGLFDDGFARDDR